MAKLIILNGSSSSGKTTLAQTLQEELDVPYQYLSLDQFRDGLPERVRGLNAPTDSEGASGLNVVPQQIDGQPATRIEFGPFGEKVLRVMRMTATQLVSDGVPTIVDDLFLTPSALQTYLDCCDYSKTWLIGVNCSVEVLAQRELNRTGRFPGTALEHHKRVHQDVEHYDLLLDTSEKTPLETAAEVILRLRQPPRALTQLAASGVQA